jgi:phosphate transport system permease protein
MVTAEPSQRPVSGRLESRTSRGIRTIPRRRLLLDRWNRGLIALGGQGVIALILAMFVFLVVEAWPLAQSPELGPAETFAIPGTSAAILADSHQTHVASVSNDGVLTVLRRSSGAVVLTAALVGVPDATVGEADVVGAEAAAPSVARVFPRGQDAPILLATNDGGLVAASLEFDIHFVDNKRVVVPRLGQLRHVAIDPSGAAVTSAAVQVSDDQTTWIAQLAGGEIVLHRVAIEENLFTGERDETVERTTLAADLDVAHWAISPDQRSVYAATRSGQLAWWHTAEGGEPVETLEPGAPITAMTLLKGGQTLVVGREDGTISNYFRIRRALSESLTRVRELAPLDSAVVQLAASGRDRSVLALGAGGEAALYYATSGRRLWLGASPLDGATSVDLTPKGDAAVFGADGSVATLPIDAPHPEVSWRTYFGRLWYEGFEKVEAVWQSTGGSDDFEAKLSLLPLLFGTLKGTLYSLFLAVPIAILGAMYTSQFIHPRLQRVFKPAVEMMASLPSVVLGLVAGLWLAPRLESHFPALVAVMVLTPVMLVVGGWLWAHTPAAFRARFPTGSEVLFFAVVLLVGWAGIFELGPAIERVAFGGDYQAWFYEALDLRYDQRNAAVVGIAMGFAVIPIIFSIAEDAFSSVPPTLAAGSLALGANRWETVTQIVLPTASPAIFSAVMVGLGRAVGETMIVLMATGNTPIMDWSVFNGFRTLSANIAVEIPEAPHGGTLYRTLFLTALLLFAFTFVINTVAEIVRIRLRKKFGRL